MDTIDKYLESTGTHVGKAMEIGAAPVEDVESDEKETEDIARKSGGDIEKMQKVKEDITMENSDQLFEQYLLFIQEKDDGFLKEGPVANLAAATAKAGASKGFLGKVAGVAGGISPVMYAMWGLPYAIKLANAAYKNTFNKAHKACSGLDKEAYTSCVRKFKLQAFQQQILAMKKAMVTCSKDKKPEACRQKIETKIKNVGWRIKAIQTAIANEKKARIAQAQAAGKAQAARAPQPPNPPQQPQG